MLFHALRGSVVAPRRAAPCLLLHVKGPTSARGLRWHTERALTAWSRHTLQPHDGGACEWVSTRGLPTAGEASLGYTIRRMGALIRAAWSHPRIGAPGPILGAAHTFDGRDTLLMLSSKVGAHGPGWLEPVGDAIIASYADHANVRVEYGEVSSALFDQIFPPTNVVTEANVRDEHASFLPSMTAAYCAMLGLGGTRDVALDVRSHHSLDAPVEGAYTITLTLTTEPGLQDVARACATATAHETAGSAHVCQSTAGLVVVQTSPQVTVLRCGDIAFSRIPAQYRTVWDVTVLAHEGAQSRIWVDSLFAPELIASLLTHVWHRLVAGCDRVLFDVAADSQSSWDHES